jgi:hypothetical protein
MVTKTEKNINEKDVTDNDPVCIVEGTQYFLAEIATTFHNGEAVVKFNKKKNVWCCLFTICDRTIAAIYSIPIEKVAVVRIIKEKKEETFDEFVGNYLDQ